MLMIERLLGASPLPRRTLPGSRPMTFRIYAESGARCLDSGRYVCRLHPEVEAYFGRGAKFSACPGPDDEDGDEAHNTTWMLVEGAERDAA